MRPPLHSTAILDTKSRHKSLSNSLTLALISHPEELPSGSIDRACHTLGPKPKVCLCFQTSVPTALANTPSRQGPLEPHRPTVPAPLKETGPIPLVTTLQIRRNLQGPEGILIAESTLYKYVHLTQPEQLPPIQTGRQMSPETKD